MEYKRLKEIDIEASNNSRVFVLFCASDVETRPQKNGGQFISLTMCDCGVKINAKLFGASETDIEKLKDGHVYSAAVDVKPYNGKASCVIYNFEAYDDNPRNYVEIAENSDLAYSFINDALGRINDPVYSQIVHSLVVENWGRFSSWSAAKSMHHSAICGLMVHTGEVAKQAELLGDYWNSVYGAGFIDMNLLLSGALLHDIGKLHELDVDINTGVTKYSLEGALIPHIVFDVQMLRDKAHELCIGLPTDDKSTEQLESETEKLNLLTHLLLSHHGVKEYGSPIEPSCPEAVLLNIADDTSAKMFRMHTALKQLKPGTVDETYIGGERKFVYKSSTKQ